MPRTATVSREFPGCEFDDFLRLGLSKPLKAVYHSRYLGDLDIKVPEEWLRVGEGEAGGDGDGIPDVPAWREDAEVEHMLQRRADYRVIGIPFPDALVAIVGTNTVGMSETETIFFTSAAARGSIRDPAADGCDEACPFFVRAVFTPALFAEYFEAIVDFDLSYVRSESGERVLLVAAHTTVAFHMALVGGLFEHFIINLAATSTDKFMQFTEDHIYQFAEGRRRNDIGSLDDSASTTHALGLARSSLARTLRCGGHPPTAPSSLAYSLTDLLIDVSSMCYAADRCAASVEQGLRSLARVSDRWRSGGGGSGRRRGWRHVASSSLKWALLLASWTLIALALLLRRRRRLR